MAAVTHLHSRPDADIAAARRLHETDGVRKWSVEAWLLAGLDDAQIARRTGLSPAVVGTYESLCFAVRRSLPMTDWLLLQCVGPAAWRGFRHDEVRQLWAYAAMTAGPLLVERLVAPVLRSGTATLDTYLDDAGLDPRLKRWVAAKTEPVAGATPMAVAESVRRLRELADSEGNGDGAGILPVEELAAVTRRHLRPRIAQRSRPASSFTRSRHSVGRESAALPMRR